MNNTNTNKEVFKIGVFSNVRGGIARFSNSCKKYNEEIEMVEIPVPALNESASKVTGCDAVIYTPYKEVTKNFYETLKANGVNYILTCTAGYDHLDLKTIKEVGLKSANAPVYSPNAIAEHAVMSVLTLLRNYREQLQRIDVSNYNIDGMAGKEIRNQVVGIVGAGRIGYTTMKCLSGFQPKKIYANDLYQNDEVKKLAEYVSIDEMYEKCDVLIYHCNYTEENHHMVNEETIKKMKDGVILVNVARGGFFNTNDILKGIESGKLGGIAIDVIDEENLIKDAGDVGKCPVPALEKLLEYSNVIYTNHTAFFTDQALKDMSDITIENAYEYKTKGECTFELIK